MCIRWCDDAILFVGREVYISRSLCCGISCLNSCADILLVASLFVLLEEGLFVSIFVEMDMVLSHNHVMQDYKQLQCILSFCFLHFFLFFRDCTGTCYILYVLEVHCTWWLLK